MDIQPRAVCRAVGHDLTALWKALDQVGTPIPEARFATVQSCLVWRDGERPTFILAEPDHAAAFAAVQTGATYGEIITLLIGDDDPSPDAIQAAAMQAGGMLGKWLQEGMINGINP